MKRDRLDVVIRLRELDERAAETRLRDALLLQAAARDTFGFRSSMLANEEAWFAQVQRTGTDGAECRRASRSVRTYADAVEAAARAVVETDRLVSAARESLATAARRREVAERLRERHRRIAEQDAERQEIGRLSDIATIQHVFRTVEEAR